MVDIKGYKCPNCNGIIRFDISTQMAKCQSCGAEFGRAELENRLDAIQGVVRRWIYNMDTAREQTEASDYVVPESFELWVKNDERI